jgi:hypothetical protein
MLAAGVRNLLKLAKLSAHKPPSSSYQTLPLENEYQDGTMKIFASGLCVAIILAASVACSQEIEPAELFKKVTAAYDALQSYTSEGTIVSDIDTGAGKTNIETSFSIKLKKPNLYRISWEQKLGFPGMTQTGAVWNDGKQPYLFMGIAKTYSKISDDQMAIASATGISGGAAHTIPSMFLAVYQGNSNPFDRLKEPKVTGSEKIEDDDCYVVSGSSAASKSETFWISKKSHLIRKHSRSLEPPEGGGLEIPEMTDEQLEQAIKAVGQEVTDETKATMKKMMKQARESAGKIKGTSTELHTKIASPELAEKDFSFQVPAGTKLTKSIFGDAAK